jgi:aryl-alcohol dehydrogenase-like predicted oxidoreductase
MKYNELGNTGLEVSAIAQGTWALGAAGWGDIDDKNSIKTIRKAVDLGVTLIDTAPIYGMGHSEEVVGKAVAGMRDKVVIATKCGLVSGEGNKVERVLTAESIRKEVDVSLKRLDTDYIDIYILHWPDVNTPVEESLGEMERLQRAGKIKHIGVSNFDRELLERSMKATKIACIQPQLSLLSQESLDLIEFAGDNGIGVLTYGSLAAGMLTGKVKEIPKFEKHDIRANFYPFYKEPMFSKALKLIEVLRNISRDHSMPVSSVAINWIIQQPGVTSALTGATMPDQIAENALAGSWNLSPDELALIDESYKKLMND